MLDIARLERIRLTRYPLSQRTIGQLLRLNYGMLPGVSVEFENPERIPDERCIYAMNHTDRYNYWPFQFRLWRLLNRFTATWVKGKYYESSAIGKFMEMMNQLPTISRGYIISRDFLEVIKRAPTNEEYNSLRDWVDRNFEEGGRSERDQDFLSSLPSALLTEKRNVLGRGFNPEEETYPQYVNATFGAMMKLFVALNEHANEVGLDILIFPQGTRSKRLLPSHTGIAELAFHLKCPVVPVGCNGSDIAYPGGSPWASKAELVYRIGEPIHHGSIPEYEMKESFEPFTAESDRKYGHLFRDFSDVVTQRIDELLDEPYRMGDGEEESSGEESDRII